MESDLKLGIYKHYKGKFYQVICLAKHSETLEDVVVYKPLYESEHKVWVRPLHMFQEVLQIDGELIPRFAFVSE